MRSPRWDYPQQKERCLSDQNRREASFNTLLSDGNGEFTKAVGLLLDASGHGLDLRSKRYVALVDNGIIKSLEVEPQGTECTITCADEILKHL